MSFTIHVTWRGRTLTISLPIADPTLNELGEEIEKQHGASFETLKLLVPGQKCQIAPARQRAQAASEAGLSNGCRVLLLASSAEEITRVRAAHDLPGMRSFDDELKRAARRRRTVRSDLNPQPPRAEYTFSSYETWQRPGLQPPPAEALKLLYRLASDPGVMGVMTAHQYRVGLLSEMPPEGKVGVSPVCILGVNINAGQEISLRLRTDDLKGFRKYERIRETLIHELAHMEYGEHDNDFKRLNSELGRECAAINARYASGGGHLLLSTATATGRSQREGAGIHERPFHGRELDDPALLLEDGTAAAVMAATARLSGKTLRQLAAMGSNGPVQGVLPSGGGASGGGEGGGPAGVWDGGRSISRGGGEGTDGGGRGSSSEGSGGGGGGDDDASAHADGDGDDPVRQFEHYDAATERAEAAAQRLGSVDEPPPPPPPTTTTTTTTTGLQQGAGNGAGDGGDGCSEEARAVTGRSRVVIQPQPSPSPPPTPAVTPLAASTSLPTQSRAATPPTPSTTMLITAVTSVGAPSAMSAREQARDEVAAPPHDPVMMDLGEDADGRLGKNLAPNMDQGLGSRVVESDVATSAAATAVATGLTAGATAAEVPVVEDVEGNNSDLKPGGEDGGVQLSLSLPAALTAVAQPPPTTFLTPSPSVRLSLRAPEELSVGGRGGGGGGGDDGDGGGGGGSDADSGVAAAAQAKLRQAWNALVQMGSAAGGGTPYSVVQTTPDSLPVAAVTAEDVASALDTLETMLGNAVHFPAEDRYRRVRLSNAAFQRRVGRLPGGVELLRVAGFVEEGSGPDAVLRLRRNDPGLLWLVLSAVREAREQVAVQMHTAGGHLA